MIRQVDKSRFDIPMSGDPRLHHELILDLVDKDYFWVVLTQRWC